MQIGKRVNRIEGAQLAAEHEKDKSQREKGASIDDGMTLNFKTHCQISNTRNDPVDIYTYVRENQADPAFSVSPPFARYVVTYLFIKDSPHHIRGLFQN